MNKIRTYFYKFIKLFFNRIFYIGVAFILQFLWILMTVRILRLNSRYTSLIINVLTIVVVLIIVNHDINPSYKLTWSVLILGIPVLGLVIYLLFGRSRIAKKMEKQFSDLQNDPGFWRHISEDGLKQLKKLNPDVGKQAHYIQKVAGYPVHQNTSAEYFQVGDELFPRLLAELEAAEHFIFIEYFIINNGVMWHEILNILERKAADGVDVRLIYDGFGCLTTLSNKYCNELRAKGIKCEVFNPFRPILNVIQNNRDHRKLCIIDGHTGFTGGINLADEYINRKRRFGHWKDTAIMLKGDAVWNMTVMFLHMWHVVTNSKDSIQYELYRPEKYLKTKIDGSGFVQPFCDSPLDEEIVGENVYLNIIHNAQKYVYICTPYLIIDNEIMTSLCLAAKNGIDVRIMTPGIPDKKIVFLLSQSYYRTLLEAGVKIYEYQPGFLHAKSFVSDDDIAVVGTINLDYRSLYLHFEDGVWMYKNKIVEDIRDDFEHTLYSCKEVPLSFCRNRSIFVRIIQNVMRLIAPLL